MTAAYAGGRLRRSRASREGMQARRHEVLEITRAHQPTGCRFVYYTATTRGVVPKNDSGYEKVHRTLLQLRREGVIPWDWVTDNNRWTRKPRTHGSLAEALEETANLYRRALWRDAETAVEVWCESESVAGVLYPITAKWDVPLYPIKGQTSDTFAYGVAQQYRTDDRRLLVLYIGDHDPHGYEIETQLRSKLVEHSGRADIEWLRLACTAADVARLQLPGTAAKKSTWRDALTGENVGWHGQAVEIEAIDPPLLRRWLEDAISEQVDEHALSVARVAEESERDILERIAERVGLIDRFSGHPVDLFEGVLP